MENEKRLTEEPAAETQKSDTQGPTNIVQDPVSGTVGKILEKTPIYQDLIQPPAKELGRELAPAAKVLGETTARTIKMMLAPLEGILWGWEKIRAIVIPEIGRRFEDKLHRMVPPKLTVAGPTLESLRFAGEEPALREMYINLLATAMDKETAERAHPAFAEIIRQMTPDEARIVQFFAMEKTSPVVTLATRAKGIIVSWEFTQPAHSLVDLDVKCEYPQLIPSYYDNLRRLEILSPLQLSPIFPADDPRFSRLRNHEAVRQQESQLAAANIEYVLHGGIFGLTSFGSQFCNACVSTSPK